MMIRQVIQENIKNISLFGLNSLNLKVIMTNHYKKETPQADTSDLENEIDELVYQLYELTPEEIEVVKNN
jgi:hypothetical protein